MKNVVQLLWSKPVVRDWTNQDLADFYRVESALVQAGLSVETDRGMTDEGDPWFVFCQAETQDVIVHCARIDGQYVVASAAFDSVLRGHDFRSVVESVLARHALVMPRQKEGFSNVHFLPSALLAALVATAFFKLSGEAHAHDIALDVRGLVDSPSFDFSALKHLIIDLDKRQVALIAAAIAYVNHELGSTHSLEEGGKQTVNLFDRACDVTIAEKAVGEDFFAKIVADLPQQIANSRPEEKPIQINSFADGHLISSGIIDFEYGGVQQNNNSTKSDAQESTIVVLVDPSIVKSAQIYAYPAEASANYMVIGQFIVSDRNNFSSTADVSMSSPPKEVSTEALRVFHSIISEFTAGKSAEKLNEEFKDHMIDSLILAEKSSVSTLLEIIDLKESQVSIASLVDASLISMLRTHYRFDNMVEISHKADALAQQTIRDFIINTYDYATLNNGNNIVLYDPTPSGLNDEKFVTIVFSDKTTMSLIGNFRDFSTEAL